GTLVAPSSARPGHSDSPGLLVACRHARPPQCLRARACEAGSQELRRPPRRERSPGRRAGEQRCASCRKRIASSLTFDCCKPRSSRALEPAPRASMLPPLLPALADLLTVCQALVVLALAVFGLHRGYLVWLHWRTRTRLHRGATAPANWPSVTVQLPLYNEPRVVRRLLHAVARFDYPRDRLRVQVLDDSTDATSAIIASVLPDLPRDLVIEHVRRSDRRGYKAGPLAHGLALSESELIAVFDADFVPPPSFLRDLVPEFADLRVGMVQARWEHLNAGTSLLTSMQRLLLDAHFVIEHWARAATGRFFNF